MNLTQILTHDSLRHATFPVTAHQIYLAHAGVCPLPAVARDAMIEYAHAGSIANQETDAFVETAKLARKIAAQLIGATASEIALIGPTSLGLNLVALGLDWQPRDQVIYYANDSAPSARASSTPIANTGPTSAPPSWVHGTSSALVSSPNPPSTSCPAGNALNPARSTPQASSP